MALTERQVELIRTSWANVVPVQDMASTVFYGRLFRIAPEVRPMFPDDMRSQRMKLMKTLGTVVDALDDLDALMPAIRDLAINHVGYGVEAAHYGKVGEALMWTFERLLGPRFDDETRAAWVAAYGALTDAIIEVAYPENAG